MTLYIASNQIFSIHWATPFGEQEVEIMLKIALKKYWIGMMDFGHMCQSWYKPISGS